MKQFKDWFGKAWNDESDGWQTFRGIIVIIIGIILCIFAFNFGRWLTRDYESQEPYGQTINTELIETRADPVEHPARIQITESNFGGRLFIVTVDGVEYLCHTNGGIIRLDK